MAHSSLCQLPPALKFERLKVKNIRCYLLPFLVSYGYKTSASTVGWWRAGGGGGNLRGGKGLALMVTCFRHKVIVKLLKEHY